MTTTHFPVKKLPYRNELVVSAQFDVTEKFMIVIINNHDYKMTRKQANGVLKVARKSVKRGIFGVEKDLTLFMKNEKFDSLEELDKQIKDYKEQGFKVYYRR